MTLKINHLRTEYLVDPLGVDAARPRLSWALQDSVRGQRQTAYQVLVASSESLISKNQADVWDSGKVATPQTAHVEYRGKALRSAQRCWWRVRVWDKDGQPHDSDIATWEMGLLKPSDWKAQWIGLRQATTAALNPAPYFRRDIAINKKIASARVTVTAHGVYELRINGQRVGDALFAPGWTDYRIRLPYQTYAVTELLQRGDNVLGAIVGSGWYCGFIGFPHEPRHYGSDPQLLAQLAIEYADGTRELIATDASWRATTGPIRYSDMLDGELYDARLELRGWDKPGYDAAEWRDVSVHPRDNVALVADVSQPVRVTETLKPISMTQVGDTFIVDMGQNMVGWVRLKVKGERGQRVQLRFAEMLNTDGTFYITNLRGAKATDTYICRGGARETFEPRFTFHGFRYVEVSGAPGFALEDLTGIQVNSDTPQTGTFECSHPMVNQLQHNIEWGQRGNFLSVPTDCPQRDERLGWMGDAQVFIRTASYNMDVAAFFTKWIQDVVDAQGPNGAFPEVAPRLAGSILKDSTAAWSDAGVIVPWTLYTQYGDTRVLTKHWDAMTRWLAHLRQENPNYLWLNDRGNDFGDWLSIAADTPKDVVATAYWAYDAQLMAHIARVLGKADEAAHYDSEFANVKRAFAKAFIDADGKIKGDTQTCYVLALKMNLVDGDLRQTIIQHLVDAIDAKNGHLSTGFVGVSYLLPVLTDAGRNDVAYKLLLNDTFPSWGYSIKHGATTIWERWDGWTADKGFQDPGMNSFNHYSLGSVGEWLYRYVAGIDVTADGAGYSRISIRPQPGPGLDWAVATYRSIHGEIGSAWKRDAAGFELRVHVPANTSAIVQIPAGDGEPVRGTNAFAKVTGYADGRAVVEVQSGDYTFRTTANG